MSYPKCLQDWQDEVGEWGDRTFTKSTPLSVLAHFRREIVELHKAHDETDRLAAREEAADCVMLLLHYAHKQGFSLEQALNDKFAICRDRKWKEPDAEGVCEHVREGEEA
jgi:NTP pyrophosphatase (non-canonical NTP hydrolase)